MNIFQKNNLMSSSYRKRTCAIIKLFKEQKSNGQAPVAGLKGSLTLMEWLFYFVEDWMCWFRMNFTVAMDAFQPRSQGAGGFAPRAPAVQVCPPAGLGAAPKKVVKKFYFVDPDACPQGSSLPPAANSWLRACRFLRLDCLIMGLKTFVCERLSAKRCCET
jgi:hypothetical protein